MWCSANDILYKKKPAGLCWRVKVTIIGKLK